LKLSTIHDAADAALELAASNAAELAARSETPKSE
jgi:hypothetical protein